MLQLRKVLNNGQRLALALFGISQIQASCNYSPPPVPSSGQSSETLGKGRMAGGAEVGLGTSASWWNSSNMTDVDVNTKWLGAGRVRLGIEPDVDVGIVGGVGPQRSFVVGPELKWRFGQLASPEVGGPAFHAAWVTGLGVGASDDYDAGSDDPVRDLFLAPYTGVLGSGGVRAAQIFVGFRFAASDTFSDSSDDLTLYPILQFGFLLRPSNSLSFFIESDLAGGLTTEDWGNSAIIFYPSAGFSYSFEAPGQ